MISPLPYANRIEYHINTKLQLEIPHDIKHDIVSALYDFAVNSEQILHKEKEYWRELYFKKINEK
jgi:hypothetical protein